MSPLGKTAEGRERNAPTDCLHEVDFHKMLRQRQQIAIVWSIEDVWEVRPDLDEDQAWQVLQQCQTWHDASCGINWETIGEMADSMFPKTEEKEML